MNLGIKQLGALLSFICLMFQYNLAEAQTKDFGDVDVMDFTEYNPEYDTTMPAVVLFRKGNLYFDANYIYQDLHARIKIINDDGINYSDVTIPLVSAVDQEVRNIKAASYNLDANGIVETSKLDNDLVYKEKLSEIYDRVSFAIPNVRSGSIIEYSFTKKIGGYYSLPNWAFHDYIPVQWSELELHIPLIVQYKVVLTGSDSLIIDNIDEGWYRGKKAINYHLAKNNLPAVENEPFLNNRNDYISILKTQLASTWYSQNNLWDWDDIARALVMNKDFGGQKLGSKMKQMVEVLVGEEADPLKICEILYAYIVNNIEWNGHYGTFTEMGIRDAFNNKKGNTADINIMLARMLQHAGIAANPTLISTRKNGTVLLENPLIEQFNMTIVAVEIGESAFVIDASSGKRSMYSPHPETMYRSAFVVRNNQSFGWITTQPVEKTSERLQVKINIEADQIVCAQVSGVARGMFAENIRSEIAELETQEEFWESKLDGWNSVQVDSVKFSYLDTLSTTVNYSAQLRFDAASDLLVKDDMIYIRPFTYLKTEENPFVKETRFLPVEFSYPYNKAMMIELEIPKGYEIEELPESSVSKLPLENAYYRFQASQNGNKVLLMSQLVIKGVMYVPGEYIYLKKMYQKMVDTQTAMIVLKKKDTAAGIVE